LVFGVDFCANVAEVIFPEGTATDSAMKWVSGLTHLELLGIDHSRITDVGLEHVASLRTLTVLSLCGTGVTDAGMKSLGGLAHLHRLDLDRTNVTDTGLKELIGLNELYSLSVCGTRVTEIGLAKLGCLPRLRAVTISVGCAGCMDRRKVERALPQCRIFGQDEKGALRLPSEDW
jgi:hypothetical protein